jgi:hypothetical protein
MRKNVIVTMTNSVGTAPDRRVRKYRSIWRKSID